jgi:hypothetical protein
MQTPDPTTTFLAVVALVFTSLTAFAVVQPKIRAAQNPPDITASIQRATQPKRRPIQSATGWGNVLPQATDHAEK